MIFPWLDHPISQFNILLFSYYDVRTAESTMNDLLPMEKCQTLDDRQEGIYNFLLRKRKNAESTLTILDLSLQ